LQQLICQKILKYSSVSNSDSRNAQIVVSPLTKVVSFCQQYYIFGIRKIRSLCLSEVAKWGLLLTWW